MVFIMGIIMRTGSGAPLGEISKLMNMDSVLAVGVESFH
jgi:hypothetical protein